MIFGMTKVNIIGGFGKTQWERKDIIFSQQMRIFLKNNFYKDCKGNDILALCPHFDD